MISSAGSVVMSLSQSTTLVGGVKDGHENRRGFRSTVNSQQRYVGIENVIKKLMISLPMSLMFAKKNVPRPCYKFYSIQMLAEIA